MAQRKDAEAAPPIAPRTTGLASQKDPGDAVVENSQPIVRVADVLLQLFQAISAKLGVGAERDIKTQGNEFRVRNLNPHHLMTGFEGAIGVRQAYEHVIFVLWETVPRGKDDVSEPSPVLRLVAGPQDDGAWACGRGMRMQEVIFADVEGDFRTHGLVLGSPVVPFLASILYHVHRMVTDPSCVAESFWQAERYPGDYSEP